MKRSIAAFLIVITTASVAWAAKKTDQEIFQKRVSKVAPITSEFAKGKTPCVCFDAGNVRRVGLLFQGSAGGGVAVVCLLPNFDSAGDFSSTTLCTDFAPIR